MRINSLSDRHFDSQKTKKRYPGHPFFRFSKNAQKHLLSSVTLSVQSRTMATTFTIDGRTLITCQDAAKLYGCSMGYIRRLARDGKIFAATIGRTYLVDRSELKRLASQGGYMSKGFVAN